jgi:hypothetical protein
MWRRPATLPLSSTPRSHKLGHLVCDLPKPVLADPPSLNRPEEASLANRLPLAARR